MNSTLTAPTAPAVSAVSPPVREKRRPAPAEAPHLAQQKVDIWLSWIAACGEDDVVLELIDNLSLRHGILTPYRTGGLRRGGTIEVRAERRGGEVLVRWSRRGGCEPVDLYRRLLGGRALLKLNDEPIAAGEFVDHTAISAEDYAYSVAPAGMSRPVCSPEAQVHAVQMTRVRLEGPVGVTGMNRVRFAYRLAGACDVLLEVRDAHGKQIAELDRARRAPGRHTGSFDTTGLPAGEYFIRLDAAEQPAGKAVCRTERFLLHD